MPSHPAVSLGSRIRRHLTPNRFASVLAVGGGFFRVGVLFLFTVVWTRSLSPAAFGRFSEIFAYANLASIVLAIGIGIAARKLIPTNSSAAEAPLLSAFIRLVRMHRLALTALTLVCLAVYFLNFRSTNGWARVAAVSAIGAPLAIATISSEAARAFGLQVRSVLLDRVIQPMLLFLAALATALLARSPGLSTAITATVIASAVGGLFGWAVLTRAEKSAVAPPPDWSRWREWAELLVAGLFASLVAIGFTRIDLLLIARLAPAESVGLYAVAQRFGEIISLPQFVLSAFVGPLIARRISLGEIAGVQRVIVLSIFVSSAFALVFLLLLAPVGPFLLGIFGAKYVAALPLVWILCLGQTVVAFTGAAGMLLMMSGGHRIFLAVVFTGLLTKAVMVLVGWWLYGLTGAAIGAAASIAALALAHAYFGERHTGCRFGPRAMLAFARGNRLT